jgi:preprotein translocase SecE subunit
MEIYKRGQGVWARGLAIIIFLLFAVWGAIVVFRLPAEMNVIVRPDETIWTDTARQLLRAGKTTIRVKGLANQPVTEDLLKPGIKPSGRIEDKDGHGIVLDTEAFDREKLKQLVESKIRLVPAISGDQLLDAVRVDPWLLGRKLAQDLRAGRTMTFEKASKGVALDDIRVQEIQERLKEYPGARVGPLYAKAEDVAARSNPQFPVPADVKPGLIPGEGFQATYEEVIGRAKETVIDAALYDEIKKLVAANRLPQKKVRIEDEGLIRLTEENLEDIGSRYLSAKRSESVETWWSTTLFTLPLVQVEVTTGLLVCVGLFVVMAGFVLYTWNWKGWNDLLIDTQTEMKKVSWPKRDELIGSSVVVIVCVLVLGVYLYVVDILLTGLADQVGLLR